MNRRSFFKLLGVAAIAPKALAEVIRPRHYGWRALKISLKIAEQRHNLKSLLPDSVNLVEEWRKYQSKLDLLRAQRIRSIDEVRKS